MPHIWNSYVAAASPVSIPYPPSREKSAPNTASPSNVRLLVAAGFGSFALAIAYASPATVSEEPHDVRLLLGGAVTLGLLVYLVYALMRPERF